MLVLKSVFYPLTLCCGYSKESSRWDDSFEYPQHRVSLDNKRDIVGQRAVNPSLSGPLLISCKHVYSCLFVLQEIAACLPDRKKEVGPVLEEVSKYFQYLHGVLQVREHQLQQEIFNVFKAEIEPVEKLVRI